jgi:hypothetical protein
VKNNPRILSGLEIKEILIFHADLKNTFLLIKMLKIIYLYSGPGWRWQGHGPRILFLCAANEYI